MTEKDNSPWAILDMPAAKNFVRVKYKEWCLKICNCFETLKEFTKEKEIITVQYPIIFKRNKVPFF